MTERTIEVTIKVDENTIQDKYPNYKSNFDDVEDFMDMIESTINGITLSDNPMDEWGYDVVIGETLI
jgi:hypothetical protein